MRTCQSCSLKDSRCHELCTDIQIYLRNSRNYKTTYVNKEVGYNEVHANQVHENLGDYLDTSGSFTEKFGHLLPTIEQIVSDHGTDRQKQVYSLMIHEKMSFSYIAEQLHMKVQSVHEVIYGHRGQGGLVRKIRKHLAKLPEANFI
ncbi:MAG: hypothetical protein HN633_11775 [Candidatus Marinimicrobia bacterium]|nr:hypothetical protein [Candidatus Neomarinimicrobiota bacterium]MBT4994202.1 hypothetical protein [Candidatus Neomarinimicrobiota bacterium]MBT5465462.1 hypothetical protein [Candidatus Neomarinimicrobiota bacterium]MBT7201755.1 hypothetical protein [Candidatus Neomarinimicrobiota bacterium]MBT7579438.1 hypothetical protein [Candidatus Neomarinimicrobiota bacterium]